MKRHATLFYLVAVICLSLFLASTATAQTATTETGVTKVTLDSGFVSAVTGLGLKVGGVGLTRVVHGTAAFPISGGAIDLKTAKAQIIHTGGLTLSVAGASSDDEPAVILESFIIDTTGATPVLTGLVVANGTLVGRLPLFNLQLPAGLTLPLKPEHSQLVLDGVGLTLTSGAAAALNSVFNVTALKGGITVGTAKVWAIVRDEECEEWHRW
jgi:hypothetical protein